MSSQRRVAGVKNGVGQVQRIQRCGAAAGGGDEVSEVVVEADRQPDIQEGGGRLPAAGGLDAVLQMAEGGQNDAQAEGEEHMLDPEVILLQRVLKGDGHLVPVVLQDAADIPGALFPVIHHTGDGGQAQLRQAAVDGVHQMFHGGPSHISV